MLRRSGMAMVFVLARFIGRPIVVQSPTQRLL
jgi:hypothetical protein